MSSDMHKNSKSAKKAKEEVPVASPSTSHLSFLKIDVGSNDSLLFLKDLLICLNYKIISEGGHWFHAEQNGTEIAVYHSLHVSGSGAYILNTGVNALFFTVKDKVEVNKIYENFLKPRHVKVRPNGDRHNEEGKYSMFFDTEEKIVIGIVSN